MKYRFCLKKEYEDDNSGVLGQRDPFNGLVKGREIEVFSSEIDADEMIELMEHLWNISKKRVDKRSSLGVKVDYQLEK